MSILEGLLVLPGTVEVFSTHHPDGFDNENMVEFCRITKQVPVHSERTGDDMLSQSVANARLWGLPLTVTSSRKGSEGYDPATEPEKIWTDIMRLVGEVQKVKDVWQGPTNWLLDWEHFVVTADNETMIQTIFNFVRYQIGLSFPDAIIEHYGFGEAVADEPGGFKAHNWFVEGVEPDNRRSVELYHGPDIGTHHRIIVRNYDDDSPITAWLSPGSYRKPKPDAWGYDYVTDAGYSLGSSRREGTMLFNPWHRKQLDRHPYGLISRVIWYIPSNSDRTFWPHFAKIVEGATS